MRLPSWQPVGGWAVECCWDSELAGLHSPVLSSLYRRDPISAHHMCTQHNTAVIELTQRVWLYYYQYCMSVMCEVCTCM